MLARERQLLERRGRLRRTARVERARTASREARRRPASCRASSTVSSAARSTSVAGALVHPLREVADPQPLHGRRSRRSRAGSARSRRRRRPGPRSPAARASRPRRRASSGRACRATSRASSRPCAARGRTSDAAPSRRSASRGRRCCRPSRCRSRSATSAAAVAAPGPGARAARAFLEQPRVHRLPAEPDVVQAPARRGDSLAMSTAPASCSRATTAESVVRDAVPEGLGAVRRRDALRVEQVLHAEGDAVQRAAVLARGDLGVGLLRLRRARRPASA